MTYQGIPMFRKRVAAGVVVLVLGAVTLSAPTAHAATSCSLVAPSRVAITAPYRGVPLRLASDCAVPSRVEWAAWYGVHPTQGVQEVALFDNGGASDTWDLYDWEPVGRWKWQPEGAYAYSGDPVPQNTTYTDIKFGSWAGLSVSRSGSRVTLTSSAAFYHPAYDRFVSWGRSLGQMQWKVPGTTTWRALKNVYSSSSGKYTYSYTVSAVRDYRVYFPATGAIWHVASPTVRK